MQHESAICWFLLLHSISSCEYITLYLFTQWHQFWVSMDKVAATIRVKSFVYKSGTSLWATHSVKLVGRKTRACLTSEKKCQTFWLSPAIHQSSRFITSLPVLGMVSLFNLNQPRGYNLISYCGFALHFPGEWWRGASFNMFISHLCVFFHEISRSVQH